MAYRRYNYKYKKRNYGRKRRGNYGARLGRKVGGTVYKAYQGFNMAKRLMRMVNTEVKYFSEIDQDNISNSGQIRNLFTPSQGTGVNERVGDSCKLLHITGRFQIALNPNISNATVRVIIFRGKNERDTAPTVTSGTSGVLESADILSPKKWDNRFDTKVLYDRKHTVFFDGRPSYTFSISKKLFGHCTFDHNSSDISDGGLWMLLISDTNTDQPAFQWNIRTTYSDN